MRSARLLCLSLALLMAVEPWSLACTVFLAASGDVVLAGNNEDWTDHATKVWFHPAGEHAYGRVYFGFGNGFPQGGMNDQGLFFDGLALQTNLEPLPERKPYAGNLLDKVMCECASVKEALELFEQYDLGFGNAQIMIGDASGDSAIIERRAIIRKSRGYQIATNFNQSLVTPEANGCPRYRTANAMLQKSDRLDVDLMRRVLDAVHQPITVYSQVYDLTHRDVYLYLEHDFSRCVRFHLDDELKLGERALDLPAFMKDRLAAAGGGERKAS